MTEAEAAWAGRFVNRPYHETGHHHRQSVLFEWPGRNRIVNLSHEPDCFGQGDNNALIVREIVAAQFPSAPVF